MTTPDYVQEAFNNYQAAAENLRDFRSEVGSVLEKEDELTKEKTLARRTLDNSVLKYYNTDNTQRSFFEDNVTVHKDIILEIKNDDQAINAILTFCENYRQAHGVDMKSVFLKILMTALKDKLSAEPAAFGLINISQGDHDTHWISPAFELKTVDKVTVTNKV